MATDIPQVESESFVFESLNVEAEGRSDVSDILCVHRQRRSDHATQGAIMENLYLSIEFLCDCRLTRIVKTPRKEAQGEKVGWWWGESRDNHIQMSSAEWRYRDGHRNGRRNLQNEETHFTLLAFYFLEDPAK